jgi:NAD+ synthetase
MRVALAQTNPVVGDIRGNAELIRRAIHGAREQGARLVVFPELSVIGYPPKDLLLKPAAIEQSVQAVQELAGLCTDIGAIIGYPCPSDKPLGRTLYNAAAVCLGGRIAHRWVKALLPTYDVFDERRYFEPGPLAPPGSAFPSSACVDGVAVGVSICEDMWNDPTVVPRQLYEEDPIEHLAEAGARVLVNCSASPFVVGKHDFRMELIRSAARRHRLPMLFCNQVGGNDELVFDGNSCAVDAQGVLLAHAKDFEEDLLVFELPLPGPGGLGEAAAVRNRIETPRGGIESAYHALVLGLRDYCRKCGFKSVVVGLSGGVDSALTGALAVAALGAENVLGVAMPSRYSSKGSIDDARELARRLGMRFEVIPIERAHVAMEQTLSPQFKGLPPDTAEENLQARLRGMVLMALSNKFGSLLVSTGNKSELAVGYCTLYGDMAGGLAVINDVPKMMVWELARWINESPASPLRQRYGGPVIPESSITKVPSAELRPNQTDQDTLPPYALLDQIIERYVERDQPVAQIIAETGIDPETVRRMVRMIDRNEYKRQQAAPGLKITGRAFGFGRRMPIAQRFDNGVLLGAGAAKP